MNDVIRRMKMGKITKTDAEQLIRLIERFVVAYGLAQVSDEDQQLSDFIEAIAEEKPDKSLFDVLWQ